MIIEDCVSLLWPRKTKPAFLKKFYIVFGDVTGSGLAHVMTLLMYAYTSSGEFLPRTGASLIHILDP